MKYLSVIIAAINISGQMNNAIYNFREPKNEPALSYKPGSEERKLLEEELKFQKNQTIDIPLIIGGKEVRTGKTGKVVMPSDHQHVLATYLSLIHISEPTRRTPISYAVFCL